MISSLLPLPTVSQELAVDPVAACVDVCMSGDNLQLRHQTPTGAFNGDWKDLPVHELCFWVKILSSVS